MVEEMGERAVGREGAIGGETMIVSVPAHFPQETRGGWKTIEMPDTEPRISALFKQPCQVMCRRNEGSVTSSNSSKISIKWHS
jgi:hypothetical protein